MADQSLNVFISHLHEDDDGLGKFKDLLAKKGVSIRDASINSEKPNNATDPEYIKSKILAPKIQWAGTMVVYITPQTRTSEWVNWEIEYANKIGKRIVGVWAHGANECDIPDALDKYADAVVGWESESILDALIGPFDEWREPSGALRLGRQITRYSC